MMSGAVRWCKTCGRPFSPTPRVQHIFCSAECRNRWWSMSLRRRTETLRQRQLEAEARQ